MANSTLISIITSVSLHIVLLLLLIYSWSYDIQPKVPQVMTLELSAMIDLPTRVKIPVRSNKIATGQVAKPAPEPVAVKPLTTEELKTKELTVPPIKSQRVQESEQPKPLPAKEEVKKDQGKTKLSHNVTPEKKIDSQSAIKVKEPSSPGNKIVSKKVNKADTKVGKPQVQDKTKQNKKKEDHNHSKKPHLPQKSNEDLFHILDSVADIGQANEQQAQSSGVASSSPAESQQLSASEYNIIRNKIENAWFGNGQGLKALISIKLDMEGRVLEAKVQPIKCAEEYGCNALLKAAERAIYEASPFDNLPLERYDVWKELQINFDTLTTLP